MVQGLGCALANKTRCHGLLYCFRSSEGFRGFKPCRLLPRLISLMRSSDKSMAAHQRERERAREREIAREKKVKREIAREQKEI